MTDFEGLELVDARSRAAVRRAIARVLRAIGVEEGAVSVAIVDDDAMRALNRAHRGKDRATDVLSFTLDDDGLPPGFDHLLGDVVVSVDTAARQARSCGHGLEVEVAVLVAHGVAHLLGHDHERGLAEARAQAECELTFLDAAGVPLAAALIGRAFTAR